MCVCVFDINQYSYSGLEARTWSWKLKVELYPVPTESLGALIHMHSFLSPSPEFPNATTKWWHKQQWPCLAHACICRSRYCMMGVHVLLNLHDNPNQKSDELGS